METLDVELRLLTHSESSEAASTLAVRVYNDFLHELAKAVTGVYALALSINEPEALKAPAGAFAFDAVVKADVPSHYDRWAWRELVKLAFLRSLRDVAGVDRGQSHIGSVMPGVAEAEAADEAPVTEVPKQLVALKVILGGTEHNIDVPQEGNLLDVALDKDVHIDWSCKNGVCDSCKVLVKAGADNLTPVTEDEKIMLGDEVNQGYRLACQALVKGPGVVVEQ